MRLGRQRGECKVKIPKICSERYSNRGVYKDCMTTYLTEIITN